METLEEILKTLEKNEDMTVPLLCRKYRFDETFENRVFCRFPELNCQYRGKKPFPPKPDKYRCFLRDYYFD